MMIEKTQRMNLLLDLYGKLLTKHQEEISLLYYSENLSLQEIADNYNISHVFAFQKYFGLFLFYNFTTYNTIHFLL